MKRREFIKTAVLLPVAASVSSIADAANVINPETSTAVGSTDASAKGSVDGGSSAADTPLITSAPMLQNYAETSVGIAFAVSAMANGFVTIGRRANLSDGQTIKCGGYRTTEISDRVIQVRITGLKPATTYYYRIGADRIEYKGGYSMKVLGTETDKRIY